MLFTVEITGETKKLIVVLLAFVVGIHSMDERTTLPLSFSPQQNVCPTSWVTLNETSIKLPEFRLQSEKVCLKRMKDPMTFVEAQSTCRSLHAAIAPLDKYFSIPGTETNPPYWSSFNDLPTFWTGFVESQGKLFYDGIPPIQIKEVLHYASVYPMYIKRPWYQIYLDDRNCFTSDGVYLRMDSCLLKLPFYCALRGLNYTLKKDLSFCGNAAYVGNKHLQYCYIYPFIMINETATYFFKHQQARDVCGAYNATLITLNLTDSTDQMIAKVLMEPLADPNRGVKAWFYNKTDPGSCSLLFMYSDKVITSLVASCTSTGYVICQSKRILKQVTTDDIQIHFNPPTVVPGRFQSGNITCDFPNPHQETDTYLVYKGGSILYQLTDTEWKYTIPIMEWNRTDDTVHSFLVSSSVRKDTKIYKCEVQRDGVGILASKKIYALPSEKRMLIFYASIRFQPRFGMTDDPSPTSPKGDMVEALDYNYFSEVSEKVNSTQISLSSLVAFVRDNLQFPTTYGWGLSHEMTGIRSVGDTLDFTIYFGVDEASQIFPNLTSSLINNITEIVTSYTPKQRKQNHGSSAILDVKSFRIQSEDLCTSEFIKENNVVYEFYPTPIGKMAYSKELCITDSKPLLSGNCMKQEAAPAKINIVVNFNCIHVINLSKTTAILGNISQEVVTESNAADIADEMANLTAPGNKLDVNDVIYTSLIMNKLSDLEYVEEKVFDGAVQTVSNVLNLPDSVLQKAQSIRSSTNRIIESLEIIATRVNTSSNLLKREDRNFSLVISDNKPGIEPFIGFQLENTSNETNENNSIDLLTTAQIIDTRNTEVGLLLPRDIIQGRPTRVVLQMYSNTNLFKTRINNQRYIINSRVASATLVSDGKVVRKLGSKFVVVIFKPLEKNVTVCGFWNYSLYDTSGGWSTEGCRQTKEEDGRIICECDHLTNFAILIDVKGQNKLYGSKHRLALSVITVVGLSLSVFGLGLTILSFMLFKHMREGRGQQTLFNLALSIFCSMIVFLVGMDRTDSYGGCIAVAVLMHYFLLVSFMWMLVEGFLQYLRFVRVLGTYIPKFMLKASVVSWGIPLIPVIVVLAVDVDLYKGGKYYCWMSRQPFYYAFLVPVGLTVLVNVIIFAIVLKNLFTRPKGIYSTQSAKERTIMNIRASISVFVLLGLTWIFGVLAVEDARLVFSYIFTILTTLQGFCIFMLFVAREKRFRNSWRKLCSQRKPQSEYASANSAVSSQALKTQNQALLTKYTRKGGDSELSAI